MTGADRDELLAALVPRLPAFAEHLPRLLSASRFLRDALSAQLRADDDFAGFDEARRRGELAASIVEAYAGLDDADALMAALRRIRRREMARIALRDLAGLAELDETLGDLSDLADACVAAALANVEKRLQARHGVPREASGDVLRPVVLGMGKLGGRELNFSSDIDLIFCHTGAGETCPEPGRGADGARALSSDEYFTKLAKETTKILVAQTADGFVFRVDTMLRPFGSAGALSASFPALEDYYQVHGREWERYALIKARPIAGDLAAGEALLTMLRPFVYRRYLDYNAIGALRDLKTLIEEEVARKGLEDNVKLGAGGIREVEFVVQSFQLVRGGTVSALRDPGLRRVLRYLGDNGYLEPEDAAGLDTAYVFLRRLENAIQMYADQQTHAMPTDEAARSALLAALQVESWEVLCQRLAQVRRFVRERFEAVFAQAGGQASTGGQQELCDLLMSGTLQGDDALEALTQAGFGRDPRAVLAEIDTLRHVRLVRAMREETARKLRALLTLMASDALQLPAPEVALVRAMRIIEAVAGRSTYLTLLRESPGARRTLLRLCAASPWLSQFISRSPMVLDSLLDPRTLYAPPARDELESDLRARCEGLQLPQDTEQAMDLLRHYQREITLRVAAADLVEALPLVQVSDRLTWLAEAILRQALAFVWSEMRAQFGEPRKADGTAAAFGVIAYGKFGGLEMGYGSDLDLVFLHDCDQLDADSEGGPRSINNGTYLARLAQRLIHWLSTQTSAGRAYEVDMELRPNGRSGLLVSSLDSFDGYQRNEAWTWEHQALTRARFVAGSPAIGEAFQRIRREVLMLPRDAEKLRREIVEMRDKMRASLDKSTAESWDIKQGAGGLIDIEFVTQYLVLRDAHHDARIVEWSDNWRQLEALQACGSIGETDVANLVGSYRSYRNWAHGRALQQHEALVPEGQFTDERANVRGIFSAILAVDGP